MQIIHSEREYRGKASVLALGTFDGVHIGHAALIRRAHDIAADMGADCVVCTFDRHPLAVLHPERAPAQLSTLEEVDALGAEGLKARLLPMDAAISHLPAVRVEARHRAAVRNGMPLRPEWLNAPAPQADALRVYVGGEFAGIGAPREDGSVRFRAMLLK